MTINFLKNGTFAFKLYFGISNKYFISSINNNNANLFCLYKTLKEQTFVNVLRFLHHIYETNPKNKKFF